MTTDALLAAVRAEPDADLPRLVYADALDDAGQAERAEFVRVQCALAGMPEWDERRPPLEDREHELLDRYEAAWLGAVPEAVWEWEWRRGFVDSVDLADLWRPFDGFAESHPVTALTTTGGAFSGPCGCAGTVRSLGFDVFADQDELAGQLAAGRWPRLRSLAFSNGPLRSPALDQIGRSAVGRQLTAFHTHDPGLDAGDLADLLPAAPLAELGVADTRVDAAAIGRLLARFARLTALDVSGGTLGGEAVAEFRRRPAPTLSRLDVSGTELGREHLPALLGLPALGELTDLQASRCEGYHRFYRDLADTPFWGRAASLRVHSAHARRDDFVEFCRSPGPSAVRLLDLADNDLGLDGARGLADAGWGGSLVWLALSRNGFGPPGVAALVGSGKFHRLRTLHLAFDPHTDESARLLAAAPSMARLRILTLSGTRVTDAAVPHLIDGPHWRLSGLGLSGLNLGGRAVHALATSTRLRRLQWLDLSANPALGGDALMPLAESPHLSRLCELDIGGVDASDRVRATLRERLGRRLSD